MEIYMNIMSLTAVELGKRIKAKEKRHNQKCPIKKNTFYVKSSNVWKK